MTFQPLHHIGEVTARSPDEARAILRRALSDAGGSATRTATFLGISRYHVYYLLRKLGMRDEQRRIHKAARCRFRLPPLKE